MVVELLKKWIRKRRLPESASKTFKVRLNSQSSAYTLPAKSAVTFKWKPSSGRDGWSGPGLDSGTPTGVAGSGEEIE